MSKKSEISKRLVAIGAAWAGTSEKRNGVYEIHPDRSYPHVGSVRRFRSLTEINEYLDAREAAAELDDEMGMEYMRLWDEACA